ncbi:hypothetical protein NM688_g2456 [Phlebia brevispora]|uniref:Uncharacterized protein n=1 Tax=Phlebia brevispora TaxID=194682 RepID=A0ACC1T8F0_9APHY|nr:hypothetical protein NM688_g2456 [Phlebia brevispora]
MTRSSSPVSTVPIPTTFIGRGLSARTSFNSSDSRLTSPSVIFHHECDASLHHNVRLDTQVVGELLIPLGRSGSSKTVGKRPDGSKKASFEDAVWF